MVVFLFILGFQVASANTGDVNLFRSTYPASQTYTRFSCNTCHLNIAVGNALNQYGLDYRARGRNLAASLTGIEATDSDRDTFSNIDEISQGSNPGDGTSDPINANPTPGPGGGSGEGGSSGGGSDNNASLDRGTLGTKANANTLQGSGCGPIAQAESDDDPYHGLLSLLLMVFPLLAIFVLKGQIFYLSEN